MVLPAEVGSILTDIGVDQQDINTVLSMLDQSYDQLDATKVAALSGNVFGGASSAASLADNTRIAHAHVTAAMVQMTQGLHEYAASIRAHEKLMTDTDDTNATAMKGATASVASVAPINLSGPESCITPTMHTNTQCTVPTGSN